MARKFEFKDNVLKLDIAGNIFEVDVFEPTLSRRINKHKIRLGEKGGHLTKKSDEGLYVKELEKELEESIQLCVGVIDDILGEGACEKIFKDRAVNFLDAIDVANFVFAEIDNYIQNDLAKKYSPNRAQRRAVKKQQ